MFYLVDWIRYKHMKIAFGCKMIKRIIVGELKDKSPIPRIDVVMQMLHSLHH